jgi:beta-lactamase regulating signal transducer with metallopeptidase domain
MSAIETMLGTPLAQAIGWALVHLVWQGIVVAGILAAILALLQRQSAHARYLVACAAMLVLLTLGAVTAYRAYDAGGDALVVPSQATTASVDDAATAPGGDTPTILARTRAVLPKIVLFWIVGVAALSFRLAGGWLRAQRLAKRSASPAAAEWQQAVARLSDTLGLRRGVELLHSAAVEVPTVLGWLRPVILLPMTLSGLSPEQIEMILAHELAHIRRHDFLVNLMQSVVETLLFYHPAVWWISARIRIEREHCCDDAAVAVGGNALQYARALTRLEELRGDTAQLALAANGGSLIERIRRVAGIRGEGPSRWVAGAALLTVVAVLFVAPSLPLFARDQAAPPPAPAAPAAPPAIASTPAPPARPAIAQSRVEVRADASDDDGDDVDVPEPAETPEPPEQPEQPAPPATPRAHAPHAPRAPRAPRATTPACPDSINVHVAPMMIPKIEMTPIAMPKIIMPAMPKITIPAIDVHIDGIPGGIVGGIEGGVRGGIEGGVRRSLAPPQKYKDALRGAGITANEHETKQLYFLGVTPRYVQSLRDAGLKKLTAHDVIRLHSMGITAGFVKELKRMQQ